MHLTESDVKARDGRTLRVREAGDLKGPAVFVHHGSPSAGLLFRPWVEDADTRGIRLLSHDRPGYGGSDPQPGRSVASVVSDVADIADHLGIDRYATWGVSGGGPHALACAALSRGRCIAAASLASVGPLGAEGLDFTEGMGEDNEYEFQLALKGRDAIEDLTKRHAVEMLAAAPEAIFEGVKSLVSEVDEAAMTGEFAQYMWECTQIGLGSSVDGWLDDDMVFVKDWGFDVVDIEVPVLVYQGRQDLMVPYSHGEWLASRIPTAEARLSDEEGHLTLLVNRVSDTHAWLMERF